MRDYTRKAKIKDSNEWVIGYHVYVDYLDEHYILVSEKTHDGFSGMLEVKQYEVDGNTICNPTELTDKNGNKIWENDVVFVTDGDGCSGSSDTGVGEIDLLLGLWYISGSIQNGLYDVLEVIGHEAEVIGNIFDNPELLERN